MLIDEACAHGGGLFRSRCGARAIGACVYCGRAFCGAHGERGPEFADVCGRKRCQTKQLDVDAHQEWRRGAARANRTSVCADERCASRMRHECSRCRLMFCDDHVQERHITDRTQDPPARVIAVICDHCAGRRKLWD